MEAAQAEDSLVGFVLADKYRVLRQIGRGGMGVVYEAEHIQLGKRVAIKLMLEKYAQDSEAIARFQREAQAAGRIGNPHIIDIVDIGVAHDGRGFVVMELLQGVSLKDVIAQGPMSPWRAIAIIKQVLRAVGAAHAKGIIHRDLKPDNIYLLEDRVGAEHRDFVKLLDFGISKIVDPDEQYAATRLTTTGVVMGTPLYMAPEQALGNPIERFADIYACGVILYEMLAGVPPFDGTTYAVLVAKLLTTAPPPLANMRTGLPVALVNAVHRALEKEPANRFRTAEQFAASLPGDRTASEIELAGTLDSGMAIAVAPPDRPRSKLPLIIGGALLAIGAAVAAAIIVSRTGGESPASAAAAGAPEPAKVEPDKPDVAPQETGQLEIKTKPPGAAITVDGKFSGNSPITIALMPGTHSVKVELDGFEVIESEETVRRAVVTSMVLPLVARVATDKPKAKPELTAGQKVKTGPAVMKTEPPKTDTPTKIEQKRVEPVTRTEPPRVDPPKVDPPKVDPPKVEQPKGPNNPVGPVGTKPNPY